MKIKQISLFLENKPGQLSEITKILSEGNIDLKAINVAEADDYGILRIITNESDKALKILTDYGFITTITPVVAVSVPNRPGGLYDLLLIFNQENINVEYMYSIFGNNNNKAYMIIKVDNPDNLTKVFEAKGLETADLSDLGLN